MKFNIDYQLDLRTDEGEYICTEEWSESVNAVCRDDAVEVIFDKYAGTPHSVHIERVS